MTVPLERNQSQVDKINKLGYNQIMTKREEELKIIQQTYREWQKTNPQWENEQSASAEDELKLMEMIETALEKNKPQSEQCALFLEHGGYCS